MFKLVAHSAFIILSPCSGWGFVSKPLTLVALVSYFFLLFTVMVLTRWITLPAGMMALIVHLLLASMVAVYVGLRTQKKTRKQYAFSTLLSVFVVLVLVGVFKYRENVLGIDVFFIPSLSMTPTLQPGDIILVDTLAYKRKNPNTGEIVVFVRSSNVVYVKRISQVFSDGVQVRGDNFDHSITEIALGKIPKNNILGKVNGVLFNTRKPLDLRRFLVIP